MYNFLLIVFFCCVLAILHSYVFYPVGLLLFSKKKRESVQYTPNDNLPEITVIMAAYNEENVIDNKIRSLIGTGYPLNKISVLIGSDASTDQTNVIVKKWCTQYPFIKLIEFKGRTGKAGIVNELVKESKTEILILTDANVIFNRETIFNLVRHFKNNTVTQVCANIIKVTKGSLGISEQEKTYMALENKIKLHESYNWNIVMGAEGGCNAIRKKNYAVVPGNFCVDDFYVSMNIIEQGGEIVFDNEAVCYEDAPSQSSVEFKRKVRISTGNFQNLFRYKNLLLTFWKGSSFAFLSHKVLRWLTPFLLILCFLSSLFLGFYNRIFFVICAVQFLGILTPLIKIDQKYFKIVSHFYLMNLALLKGFFKFLGGVETNIWQPTKRNV